MTAREPGGRRVPAWLAFGVLAASVGLLAWFVGRDLDALEALGAIAPLEVVAILALQGLYLLPESYRQQVAIEAAAEKRLRRFTWFRIFIIGRFLNRFVPQSGNVYRALRLRTDFGIGYVDFVGAMVLFLMLSVGLNLALASVLMAIQAPDVSYGPLSAPWALALAALLVVTMPVIVGYLLQRITIPDGTPFAPIRVLRDLLRSASEALRRPRLVVRFVGAWAVTLAVIIALYGLVLSAVGASVNAGEVVALYALVQVTSFVVITPGNLGIQELGFVGLGALFGVPLAQGAVAAAIIRVTGTIAMAIPAIALGAGDVRSALRHPNGREESADDRPR